ncbi:MAG: VOC family protein [Candidatus Izemoplasmatales bacterium]
MVMGIAHLAFRVTDMERSVRFYETALGFTRKFELHDPQGAPWIVYLQVNERQFVELFCSRDAVAFDGVRSGYQHLCVEVTDIEGLAAGLAAKGIRIVHPVIVGLDHNRQCWIADPDGNPIELMEYGRDALQLR